MNYDRVSHIVPDLDDDEELQAADRAGVARVSLGAFVLRTETVCAAVLGAILVTRGAGEGDR